MKCEQCGRHVRTAKLCKTCWNINYKNDNRGSISELERHKEIIRKVKKEIKSNNGKSKQKEVNKMAKITMEDAKEYFIKLCLDGDSKDELATEIWRRMSTKERKKYYEELEEYSKNGKLE